MGKKLDDIKERLAEQLKAEILELAKTDVPRPADDSVYGLAITLFTTPEISKAYQINLINRLYDALWNDLGAKFTSERMPPEGSVYDIAIDLFAELDRLEKLSR